MGVDFERGIAVLDAFLVSLEIEVAERPVGEVAWIVAVDVDGLGVVGEGLGVVLPLVGLVSHLFVFLSCAVVLDVHSDYYYASCTAGIISSFETILDYSSGHFRHRFSHKKRTI